MVTNSFVMESVDKIDITASSLKFTIFENCTNFDRSAEGSVVQLYHSTNDHDYQICGRGGLLFPVLQYISRVKI